MVSNADFLNQHHHSQESAYQLLLLLLTWLVDGEAYLLPMATSLLVMSKVRAERHLSLQPPLEMAVYLPIFSLAAIFRIGSLALIFGSVPAAPDSVISFLYFNVAFFAYGSLTPLLLLVLSRSCPPINQLTALQACQGVIGQYSKDFYPFFIPWNVVSGESTKSSGSFSTVSVWPSLDHKTVKSIQKVEAIFFMVCASSLCRNQL